MHARPAGAQVPPMWTCSKCGESVEEQFDVCWKCGTSWDGVKEDPAVQADSGSVAPEPATAPDPRGSQVACVRCSRSLEYLGRKRFHEGANWGVFGEIGELFVKREHFDVYVCPQCGRVEFFVDGIGEQLRPN